MRRVRTVSAVLPAEVGVCEGIAYSLWLPSAVRGGVVILHGAGSCKESHHDFARVVVAAGLAAVAFDQRGHGASAGPMSAGVVGDVVLMAGLLRERCGVPRLPLALRGSSMGGYLALVAAADAGAQAVVAICPASAEGLRRGLTRGAFDFDADVPALGAFLDAHPLPEVVERLEIPVLILHAEGDEQVPIELSRELAERLRSPESRLIAVPGGHHRSIQHDGEMQAVSLRFIERALGVR